MKYRNSHGKLIEIYDTDEMCRIDSVYDNYQTETNVQMMLKTIEEVRGTRKRSVDKFVKRFYQEEQYQKYCKVDTIY